MDIFLLVLGSKSCYPAQFEAARVSECECIHMWIKGLRTALAFVELDGQPEARLKIGHSLAYQE